MIKSYYALYIVQKQANYALYTEQKANWQAPLLENDWQDDEVKLTLFVPESEQKGKQKSKPESKQKSKPENKLESEQKTEDFVLACIINNPFISRAELAAALGKSESTVYKYISKLKNSKRIERVGGDKGGHWVVTL